MPGGSATGSVAATGGATAREPGERGSTWNERGSLPSGSGIGNNAIERVESRRRRTTGMVVYHATEKDCVGENEDGLAECVICFEEFEVGAEMGRLECLCKFHKVRNRHLTLHKGLGSWKFLGHLVSRKSLRKS